MRAAEFCLLLSVPLIIAQASGQRLDYGPNYPFNGAYCSKRPYGSQCCTGRRDDCSAPISTTMCYCDEFCNQHGPNRDCCPDYERHCHKELPPGVYTADKCFYDGVEYSLGQTARLQNDCYLCTCTKISQYQTEMKCGYVCTPTTTPPPQPIRDKCFYDGVEYSLGQTARLQNDCYLCTCTRISQYQTEMKCGYVCSPTTTPPPQPIRACYYSKTGKYYGEGDSFRDGCKTCTCRASSYPWAGFPREVTCYPETCPTITPKPAPYGCYHNSQYYKLGYRIRVQYQECECKLAPGGITAEFVCSGDDASVDIFDRINRGNYGWKVYRYHFLTGKSLDQVYRQRTGICRPATMAINQNITSTGHHNLQVSSEAFDARSYWPGKIRPISDQRDQPISWALAVAELATDRTAIQTDGRDNIVLSAQNLISCISPIVSHCSSTIQTWNYLYKFGVVSEDCYPRANGSYAGTCRVPKEEHHYGSVACLDGHTHDRLHRLPQHYKVSNNEMFIMLEIHTNGPVLAHIRVKEDFFYYQSGVYRHVAGNMYSNTDNFQAVRIVGWGTDRSQGSPTKYWLCTNSWGTDWGEKGYFRILRGANECEIEAHVFGVLAQEGVPYFYGSSP